MKFPAEPAAKKRKVDLDLFLGNLEGGRERLCGSGRMLDGRPELTGVALHIRCCIERLHRSVGNEWYLIHRLNFLRCGGESLIHVAVISNLARCFTFGQLASPCAEKPN